MKYAVVISFVCVCLIAMRTICFADSEGSKVYIEGAVKTPGWYRLEPDKGSVQKPHRLHELINTAGLKADGELQHVYLIRRDSSAIAGVLTQSIELQDGDHIHVPARGQKFIVPSPGPALLAVITKPAIMIDQREATLAETLEKIPFEGSAQTTYVSLYRGLPDGGLLIEQAVLKSMDPGLVCLHRGDVVKLGEVPRPPMFRTQKIIDIGVDYIEPYRAIDYY